MSGAPLQLLQLPSDVLTLIVGLLPLRTRFRSLVRLCKCFGPLLRASVTSLTTEPFTPATIAKYQPSLLQNMKNVRAITLGGDVEGDLLSHLISRTSALTLQSWHGLPDSLLIQFTALTRLKCLHNQECQGTSTES